MKKVYEHMVEHADAIPGVKEREKQVKWNSLNMKIAKDIELHQLAMRLLKLNCPPNSTTWEDGLKLLESDKELRKLVMIRHDCQYIYKS